MPTGRTKTHEIPAGRWPRRRQYGFYARKYNMLYRRTAVGCFIIIFLFGFFIFMFFFFLPARLDSRSRNDLRPLRKTDPISFPGRIMSVGNYSGTRRAASTALFNVSLYDRRVRSRDKCAFSVYKYVSIIIIIIVMTIAIIIIIITLLRHNE